MPPFRKVEAQANIDAAPQLVLDAFTEQSHLNGWWAVERSLVEKLPGGSYALAWGISDKGFQYVSAGVVQEYEPARLLKVGHFSYFNPERDILGGMGLTVELSARGQGTHLQLCQDGYRSGGDWDWYFEAVTTAWPQALGLLKKYLEAL